MFNAFLQEHCLVVEPVLHLQLQFASKASGAQFNFQPWLTGLGASMLQLVDCFHTAAW